MKETAMASNSRTMVHFVVFAVMLFELLTIQAHADPCDTEIPKAKRILEQGTDINAHDEYQRASLHYAAFCGETGLAALLIKKGADVSARDEGQSTPLHIAACGNVGHAEVAALLIRKGADINARDKEQDTPLHIAAGGDDTKLVALLIQKGADINARDKGRRTPLHEDNIIGRGQYRGGCPAD